MDKIQISLPNLTSLGSKSTKANKGDILEITKTLVVHQIINLSEGATVFQQINNNLEIMVHLEDLVA